MKPPNVRENRVAGGDCPFQSRPAPRLRFIALLDGSLAFVFVVPNRDHPKGATKGSATGALLNPNDLGPFVLGQPLVYFVFKNLPILTFCAQRVIHAEYLDTHAKVLQLQMSFVFDV